MYPQDKQRDAEMREWNRVLAEGTADEINEAQERLLIDIHTRIMNDDPNYEKAGWTP